jgi:hypothetical protein
MGPKSWVPWVDEKASHAFEHAALFLHALGAETRSEGRGNAGRMLPARIRHSLESSHRMASTTVEKLGA